MRTRWIAALTAVGIVWVLASPHAGVAASLTGQERAEAAGRGLLGSPAPKLVLKTIDGDTIDLGALYGKKAVYLKFWATWCVPCRQQMPHFEHTYETAGPDLAVIAINTGFNDSLEQIRAYRRKLGITMPIVFDDGSTGAAFNLRVTPQHIVIGRDGRIAYVGNLADTKLDEALTAARTTAPTRSQSGHGGRAIPVKETAEIRIGDRMPALSAKTLDGGVFHGRDAHAQRPTVLLFMSPWCESYLATSRPGLATSCRQVREQVDALAKNEADVRWLAVASGLWATNADLLDYQKQYRTAIPLTLDESGVWFRSFRVMSVPTLVIADAGGQIVRRVDGFDANLPAQLQSVLRK